MQDTESSHLVHPPNCPCTICNSSLIVKQLERKHKKEMKRKSKHRKIDSLKKVRRISDSSDSSED